MLPLRRVCLALWLISSRKCVWALEQPISSLAHRHPRFQELLRAIRIFRASLWLSHYGARSPKRIKLFSNSSGVRAFRTPKLTRRMRERLPLRLATSKVKADGKKAYTGNKASLTEFSPETYNSLARTLKLEVVHARFTISPEYSYSNMSTAGPTQMGLGESLDGFCTRSGLDSRLRASKLRWECA